MSGAGRPNWDAYARTTLELGPDLSVVVDLRRPLNAEAIGALKLLGLGDRFAVMTASNPRDRKMRANENRRRNRRLQRQLDFRGIPWQDGVGRDPENVHRERSLAMAASEQEAVALAALYGQNAIFWFDGGRFWIVGALQPGRVELPVRDDGAESGHAG